MIACVRSAPVAPRSPPVPKRGRGQAARGIGRMQWIKPSIPSPDIDMATVCNLPKLLQRHVFLLERAGKLDIDKIRARGCVEIDVFGDAKADGYRSLRGHVTLLLLHMLPTFAAQTIDSWLPFGVCVLRNQQQATIDLMWGLGTVPLRTRVAALDGMHLFVDGVAFPIKLGALGDGAWMRLLTHRSAFNAEIPLQPKMRSAVFFKGRPCWLCEATFEEIYSNDGAGTDADVSGGDTFRSLVAVPRGMHFYGPMHGLGNTLGGVIATIGRLYYVLVNPELRVVTLIDKLFYSAKAPESWDIYFQRDKAPLPGRNVSRSSKHAMHPWELGVRFVRGGCNELRELMVLMQPQ